MLVLRFWKNKFYLLGKMFVFFYAVFFKTLNHLCCFNQGFTGNTACIQTIPSHFVSFYQSNLCFEYRSNIALSKVVFPLPDNPIIPTVLPAKISKFKLCNIFLEDCHNLSELLKETDNFSNESKG